jgi:non-canonical purine NTP pyrophosphatase (RdgB/HAM1 family)
VLVLATLNAAKGRELAALLGDVPYEIRILADFEGASLPDEGATSYRDNALAKARAAARVTGTLALADDSGLEVDALGGAPGVLSARFGGAGLDDAGRNAHLLDRLHGVPAERRTARFRCVIALVDPDGRERTAEGTVEGLIVEAPRGAGGFGYDPLFLYPPLGRTFGELPAAEKATVSHRAAAMRVARRLLGENRQETGMADGDGLFDIIHTTRAMRRLRPDPVPDALILQILAAGAAAPTGGNRQHVRFLVITDPEIKKRVQVYYKRALDAYVAPRYRESEPPPGVTRAQYDRQLEAVIHLTDHFHEAPVWIVACLEEGDERPTRWSGASVYPAVQNMLLAARALGLGATLTTRHLLFEAEAEAALGLPPGVHSYAILPVGYPMGRFGPVRRRPLADLVFFDRWGQRRPLPSAASAPEAGRRGAHPPAKRERTGESTTTEDFWPRLERLAERCEVVIDRPRGSAHPRHPSVRYPVDYGYLQGTAGGDGAGIDVWRGSRADRRLDAIVCTVDGDKQDAELKLLLGCTAEETASIVDFLNRGAMAAILVERPSS